MLLQLLGHVGGVGVASEDPLLEHEVVELVHLLGGPKKSEMLNSKFSR